MNENDRQDEELPRAIVERLRARDRKLALLTPQVDAALARAAAEHFARRRERAPGRRRWAVPAALAATLLAAVVVTLSGGFNPAGPPEFSALRAAADDVDGSGEVDILDAFALARSRAEASGASAATQRDVTALAARIVALSPPSSAQRPERVL